MRTFVANVERLAGLFLLGVALLTAATVTLRYLFAIQIPDWFDFAKLAQGIAIFWGIAAATYRNDHISVDLVWEHAGDGWRRRLDIAATLLVAIALGVFAWMVVRKVFDTADTGQVTTDLRLPLWPFYGVAAFGIVAAFVLALIRLWHLFRGDAPEAMD